MVVKCIFLSFLLVFFCHSRFFFMELKLLDFFCVCEFCSLSFLFCSDLATPPADTHARPTVTGLCKVIRAHLEKAMATHSSTLAWKIPWTEEPGGLQSMGWLRVGDDWATSLSLFTFMHQRRGWQPTLVFLPGESTHSSVLAWRIPGTEEPSGPPSMGSHRVGHDWSDLAAAAAGHTQGRA